MGINDINDRSTLKRRLRELKAADKKIQEDRKQRGSIISDGSPTPSSGSQPQQSGAAAAPLPTSPMAAPGVPPNAPNDPAQMPQPGTGSAGTGVAQSVSAAQANLYSRLHTAQGRANNLSPIPAQRVGSPQQQHQQHPAAAATLPIASGQAQGQMPRVAPHVQSLQRGTPPPLPDSNLGKQADLGEGGQQKKPANRTVHLTQV